MRISYSPNRIQLYFVPFTFISAILLLCFAIYFAISRKYNEMAIFAFYAIFAVFTAVGLYITAGVELVFDDKGIKANKRKNSRFYSWDDLTHGYVWYAHYGKTYAILSCKELDYKEQKRILNRAMWSGYEYCDEHLTVYFGYYRDDKLAQQVKSIIKERVAGIDKI